MISDRNGARWPRAHTMGAPLDDSICAHPAWPGHFLALAVSSTVCLSRPEVDPLPLRPLVARFVLRRGVHAGAY